MNALLITDRSISILVQGKVVNESQHILKQLREIMPNAEIILSTWECSNITDLDYDKIIFNSDPDAVYCDEVTGTLNNVNRQLISTQTGLAATTRPFILKTRTDILIHNSDFLEYFGRYDDVPSTYFRNRLLICNYYTRNPRVFDTCFHPSDWIVFGRAEDVRAYYESIPLMGSEEGNWFRTREKASTFFTNYLCRFTPEQHIFLNFLRQHSEVDCQCYYDHRKALVEQTERAFAECFVVLDYQKQLGITFPKYNPNRYLEKHTLIHHWQWKALYQHYCANSSAMLWRMYLVYAGALCLASKIRTCMVRLLGKLGLKEMVKSMLRKNKL